MAALREMGLTAALLAATGGAALATWSYFSARRRKAAAARDTQAEPEGGKGAPEAEAVPGAGERRVYADIPPQQQVAEDRAGADTRHDTALTPEPALPVQPAEAADLPASTALPLHGLYTGAEDLSACTASRHDAGLTQHGPHTEELTTCTVLTQHGPDPGAEELTVSTALTQHSPHTGAEELTACTALTQHCPHDGAVDMSASAANHNEGEEKGKVAASGEPPVRQEASSTHSSAPTPPQVKTSPSKQVIVLGLDGSGKTSVLNSMAANKGNVVTTPTGGVNALCVNEGNSKMEFLEIGGSEQLRPYWKMYLSKAFAVIFVVDAADHSRLPLAKRHLHQLIQQDAVLPLIVLANKQDLEHAYHITEIHDALALSEICESRKLFLIGTHVTSADSEMSTGIQDAKEYLVQLFSEHSV